MNEKVRVHVLISGLVQGVFFRSHTRIKAKEFGVFGWVRNLADGKVEAVFEGEKESIEKIIEWTKKGPDYARVENVEIKWENYNGEFEDFEVRRA
ncbi:acylphosphatase [Parcubacteria bacterium DG_74_2]|nr:MAG: acylphosphatase [Parcubacteria bacterium DG_74_2]